MASAPFPRFGAGDGRKAIVAIGIVIIAILILALIGVLPT
jgi:hypothetical protein